MTRARYCKHTHCEDMCTAGGEQHSGDLWPPVYVAVAVPPCSTGNGLHRRRCSTFCPQIWCLASLALDGGEGWKERKEHLLVQWPAPCRCAPSRSAKRYV